MLAATRLKEQLTMHSLMAFMKFMGTLATCAAILSVTNHSTGRLLEKKSKQMGFQSAKNAVAS